MISLYSDAKLQFFNRIKTEKKRAQFKIVDYSDLQFKRYNSKKKKKYKFQLIPPWKRIKPPRPEQFLAQTPRP